MSPQGDFDQMTPTRKQRSGAREAAAGYFRKPNGWITVSQYKGGASLEKFLDRGFEPLRKYGDVTQFLDAKCEEPDPAGIWGPILRHPDGAAEFPVAQIITARWYKPDVVPVEVRWPQLRGVKIKQYQCPQCSRDAFISATKEGEPVDIGDGIAGLANHLQYGHSWVRLSLMAYGDRVDIDFSATGKPTEVVEYTYEEDTQVTPEPEPVFTVEDGTGEPEPVSCECGWVPKADSKSPRQSLVMHQRLQCKLTKEAVTA